MISNKHQVFLQLVRQGIGHSDVTGSKSLLPSSIDWKQLSLFADKQGLSAVILDALNTDDIYFTDTMPVQIKLEWIGEVLQNYERRYVEYEKAISLLAEFYNTHGWKLMVLKGYGLSLNYPNPSHRPCGDIDIWLFGQQHLADKALCSWFKEQGSSEKIDSSHHHHTVFSWRGFIVENHYDFVNVHYGHKNASLEKILEKLAQDDSLTIEIHGEKIYLPSANLHALFLLRHCMQDFASSEMNLRQVLDWGTFIEKHTNEIDWPWLLKTLEDFKMMAFYNCISAICVGNLGFDVNMFPNVQFKPELDYKVLNDILSPAFGREEPRSFSRRLVYKYRRWQGNAWKQKLCYGDNRWNSFWSGVWNHLLKPKSI